MAIEIVPRPKKQLQVKISFFNVLYYSVVFLFFAGFVFYLTLFFFDKKLQTRLAELNVLVLQKETKEVKVLEKSILMLKKKVDAFSGMLNARGRGSALFDFLESFCHKKVFFPKVELDVEASEVKLLGRAQDFAALKEQVLILKQEELVKDLSLSDISIFEEGGVQFSLVIFLDPSVFQQKNEYNNEHNIE